MDSYLHRLKLKATIVDVKEVRLYYIGLTSNEFNHLKWELLSTCPTLDCMVGVTLNSDKKNVIPSLRVTIHAPGQNKSFTKSDVIPNFHR